MKRVPSVNMGPVVGSWKTSVKGLAKGVKSVVCRIWIDDLWRDKQPYKRGMMISYYRTKREKKKVCICIFYQHNGLVVTFYACDHRRIILFIFKIIDFFYNGLRDQGIDNDVACTGGGGCRIGAVWIHAMMLLQWRIFDCIFDNRFRTFWFLSKLVWEKNKIRMRTYMMANNGPSSAFTIWIKDTVPNKSLSRMEDSSCTLSGLEIFHSWNPSW